jgi:hypothetical protein
MSLLQKSAWRRCEACGDHLSDQSPPHLLFLGQLGSVGQLGSELQIPNISRLTGTRQRRAPAGLSGTIAKTGIMMLADIIATDNSSASTAPQSTPSLR